MRHLFIVAHPDDEILGCGGIITRLKKAGDYVSVAVLCCSIRTREDCLKDTVIDMHRRLGIDNTYCFDYVAMKLNEYDRLELTQTIEDVVLKEQPDTIYTHDPNDIHIDHRTLYQLVIEASKLPLRQVNPMAKRIKAIYTIEVPSSTDWGGGFVPNAYVEIPEEALEMKARLLEEYTDVIRSVPHPRNIESFMALARYRGGQCGCRYAEALKKVFEYQ